jgi:hypothetical protein
VGKGAVRAVPTIQMFALNGGHASLCPPYDLSVVIASEAKRIASSLRSSQ